MSNVEKEQISEPTPDPREEYLNQFEGLARFSTMYLPADMFPYTWKEDNYTSSATNGPIWCYMLIRNTPDGKERKIFIADGYHRFYHLTRNKDVNTMGLVVMKVKPSRENEKEEDIHLRYPGSFDEWYGDWEQPKE